MGERRRKLSREDLEAMRQEFVVGERGGGLDDDLHQLRRSTRLGVSPEDWARAEVVSGPRTSKFSRKSRKITHLGDAQPVSGVVE